MVTIASFHLLSSAAVPRRLQRHRPGTDGTTKRRLGSHVLASIRVVGVIRGHLPLPGSDPLKSGRVNYKLYRTAPRSTPCRDSGPSAYGVPTSVGETCGEALPGRIYHPIHRCHDRESLPNPTSVLFASLWCNSDVHSSGPIRVICVIRGSNRFVPSSRFSGGSETAAGASSGDGRHYNGFSFAWLAGITNQGLTWTIRLAAGPPAKAARDPWS